MSTSHQRTSKSRLFNYTNLLLLSVILLASGVSVQAKVHEEVRDFISTARGLFSGLSGGFYEDETYLVDEECLGDTATIVLEAMVDGWSYYENVGMFLSTFTSIINFGNLTYNNCQVMPFIYDTLSFCYAHKCDMFSIIVNLSGNGA